MTRADYNEFLHIRSTIRKNAKAGIEPIMWHIRVTYSTELKQKADELIRATGFYPCRVGEPSLWRNDGDFIIYIKYRDEADWKLLTTDWERAKVAEALRA